ncbi:hypothetical protein LTR48_000844 [Friedmanniomyces endolithicus]|uniref:Inner centromere protein ARK-binding domain-containing protein n=1 Tax=Rachicladosporium monterosium TaxID=1507873 RepID=A0ABR0LF29_9PEZI|nr:hypothetical protein LTR48_000844 [Friedmanniomyces endolithicus]KAK5147843.1 hypothetical protein LTR32_000769 [Rachicladosporium monterosium]
MPRVTRAMAADFADKLHVDEDVVLALPTDLVDAAYASLKTPEPADRAPLGDIAPNSGGNAEDGELRKSTRTRKVGKKAVKDGKVDLAGSTAEEDDTSETGTGQQTGAATPGSMAVMIEVMQDAMGSRDSENGEPHVAELMHSEAATKMAETESHSDAGPSQGQSETIPLTVVEQPPSPPPSAVPNVVALLRKDTPGKRSTSNKENVEPPASPMPPTRTPRLPATYDALEQAVVHAATPPAPSRQPSSAEITPYEQSPAVTEADTVAAEVPTSPHPIDAMDALEDAVEKVSLEVPNVHSTPEKPKSKKAVPIVRTTKASLLRLSMIQAETAGAAGRAPTTSRARPSTLLGRTSSIRQSIATNTRSEPLGRRVPSAGTKKPDTAAETREKKDVVIPHSKPRPVSLSFPTPPPPPKSKKAPTTSTFQLPGEAVAAKLRAAREERTKKDTEEEQKKPAFKARPVPSSLSRAPSVRQTNLSKARESLMAGKPISATPSSTSTHKRAQSTVAPSVLKPRTISKDSSTAPRTSLRPPLSELKISKQRPSTAMANLSKPRVSKITPHDPTSMAPPPARLPSSGKGTTKGKEVFNRAAAAKDAAEKEKREKEEAAKRARLVASERGRQASREWAEKQKAKKAVIAATVAAVEAGDKAEVSDDVLRLIAVEHKADVLLLTGSDCTAVAGGWEW